MADNFTSSETPARQRRRSPAPQDRQRDAERTRRALLDAALAEFAAKGRAGARVSEIAERAGVNKQLISYYFGGKDGLYRALVAGWQQDEAEFARPDLPFAEIVAGYVRSSVEHREMSRLFVRECLDDVPPPEQAPAVGPGEAQIADLRGRQQQGEIAADLDPAFLLLALQGAASVGVTFPGDVRTLTGLDPASDEFADRYAEQLRRMVSRLASSPQV
jgi:TetR/AcrR family transcriptional regulator